MDKSVEAFDKWHQEECAVAGVPARIAARGAWMAQQVKIDEMLKALELMVSTYPYSPPCSDWAFQVEAHKTAQAAIAKAKAVTP